MFNHIFLVNDLDDVKNWKEGFNLLEKNIKVNVYLFNIP